MKCGGPSKKVALCDGTGHVSMRLILQKATWYMAYRPTELALKPPASIWSFPFLSIPIVLPFHGSVLVLFRGSKHKLSGNHLRALRPSVSIFPHFPHSSIRCSLTLTTPQTPIPLNHHYHLEFFWMEYQQLLNFLFTVPAPLKLYLSTTVWPW